jgi:hypothetical protein
MRFYVTLHNGCAFTVHAANEDQAKQQALYQNAWEGRPGSWVVSCFAG